jgi:hypothetical protein
MRKSLLLVASATIIFGASLLSGPADAMIAGGPAGARIAADQMLMIEPVARVCRKFCNDEGFCRERCQYVRDDDDEDRGDRRRERWERERREREHDDGRHCARVGPVMVCD